MDVVKKIFLSQLGFGSLFFVILLVVAVIGGTYLVQQRTNLIPFAATDPCGGSGGSGDEKGCTKFTITGCKPEGNKDTCDVKFEWVVVKDKNNTVDENIDLRVTRTDPTPEEVVYNRTKTTSGKTLNLKAGKYNAVISHTDGDDINNKDKLPFTVGEDKKTFTWGTYSGPASTKTTEQKKTEDAEKAKTASTNKAKEKDVPTPNGDFPKGDFQPRADKQELLNKFINGDVAGTIECRKTNAQGNQGSPTGDNKTGDTSLWVVPDKATADIPAKGLYIIDCSRSAIGSYKNPVTCGKLKGTNKYGCIDETLKNASTDKDAKKDDSKTTAKATDAPTLTEKQIKDCGFTITESGVPVFAVQVGGRKTSAIEEKTCDQIRAAQLKYFESAIKKAQEEAEEARKNGDTAKADELKKKADEASKAVEKCEGKKDTEFVNCAKEAQKVIEPIAKEAQSQAVLNAYKKMQFILSQGDGTESKCVKADMGVAPFLEAPRIRQNDKEDEARRLLLCTGTDKKFKWRVLVGGKAGSEFSNDGEDQGNDAERILGLHGTESAAVSPKTDGPYEPQFEVKGKNGFIIYGQDKASVEKTLEKYLIAAKAGTTSMRSAPVDGDNGSTDKDKKTDETKKDDSSSATFTKLNPSVAKDEAKYAKDAKSAKELTFSKESGKKYTCAESSDSKLKNVIVKIENDGTLAKKVEVVCNNGTDRTFYCAEKAGGKELGCYNQSDLK